jgi:putative addiction module component (TIGR02574 family)
VVEQLEQSLTPHDGFATKEIAQAWSKEIDRRLEAYLSGETKGIPYEEAMASMRQALEEHRGKSSNGS